MYPDYTRHIERLPRFTPYVASHKYSRPEYGWSMGTDYWIVFSYKTQAVVWRNTAWQGSGPSAVAERLNR